MQVARMSVWHVLVVRVALVVGWAEQGGQLRMFRLPLVFAPILVPNTKAQSIYNSLFAHPAHHHVWRGLFRILDAAVVGIASYECDAATSNLKMLSHILSLAKRPHYTCHWLCSLHQLKIVETSLCGLLGASFLSRLYSVTLLLRTGGFLFLIVERSVGLCVFDSDLSWRASSRSCAFHD